MWELSTHKTFQPRLTCVKLNYRGRCDRLWQELPTDYDARQWSDSDRPRWKMGNQRSSPYLHSHLCRARNMMETWCTYKHANSSRNADGFFFLIQLVPFGAREWTKCLPRALYLCRQASRLPLIKIVYGDNFGYLLVHRKAFFPSSCASIGES